MNSTVESELLYSLVCDIYPDDVDRSELLAAVKDLETIGSLEHFASVNGYPGTQMPMTLLSLILTVYRSPTIAAQA